MSATEEKLRDYLRKATADLRQTRQRLAAEQAKSDEPLAIVGMACRYPGGVTSPEDLWSIVAEGRDAITEFPDNRGWDLKGFSAHNPQAHSADKVMQGGFLNDPSTFDAAFFGISPREALAMDPQQRLMLETSWEALERAGIDPTRLKGAQVGVFTGAFAQKYAPRYNDSSAEKVAGSLLLGNATSVLSGRIAYVLGLEGPAITVDTACSASLVSLHLAARALRSGDCEIALAGGVTVNTTLDDFAEFCRQGGVSADGRCRAFSASANGTGWSEGAGVLVVERVSDARRNGHRILAVIRGSAINQDGASNGLSAPNEEAQVKVIRQALANASLTVDDVDLVEGHGTGTVLGDPVEGQALQQTYGTRTNGRPLWLGSLKSNIGHTQAAAGVGGVIKTVMAMRAGVVPKTLHAGQPTSHVDWSSSSVALATETREWSVEGRPRRAAVSSFGMSGTNAHAILEEAPREAATDRRDDERGDRHPVVWPVSAKSNAALRAQAGRLLEHVAAHPYLDVDDIRHSLVTSRALFEHRAVVTAADRTAGIECLRALADGEQADGLTQAVAATSGMGPVFVFPGQGSQWAGMGLELARAFPVFTASLSECAQALKPEVAWDLHTELAGNLDRVDVVQPASWAVMVSLYRLWRSFGVEPAAVMGHSQGEIAAAVACDALSLADGARVVARRSQVIAKRLAGRGAMASIALSADETGRRIASRAAGVSVAARNGPASTVVSGDIGQVEDLLAGLDGEGVRTRLIAVDYASHSAHVETIRDELLEVLGDVRPRGGNVPMISTTTGEPVTGEKLGAEYWYRNLRQTVVFGDVIRRHLDSERRAFLEVSSHPVLAMDIEAAAEMADATAVVVGSSRRDDGGADRFLRSVAEAHVSGVGVDWVTGLGSCETVDLPTYAFQGQRHWIDPFSPSAQTDGHPLNVVATPIPGGEDTIVTATISAHTAGWVADHMVAAATVVPGTTFVELALRAGDAVGLTRLDELVFRTPLVVSESDETQIQVVVGSADESGRRRLTVYSRTTGPGQDPVCHAEGFLAPATNPDVRFDQTLWPPSGAEPVDVSRLYTRLEELGYEYGPALRGITAAWRLGDEIFTEVALPEDLHDQAHRYGMHPALMDAAFHGYLLHRLDDGDTNLALPFMVSGIEMAGTGATTARVRLTPPGPGTLGAVITDPAGQQLMAVESFALRDLPDGVLPGGNTKDLYTLDWVPAASPAADPDRALTECDGDLASLTDPVPDAVLVRLDPGEVTTTVPAAFALARQWLAEDRFAHSRLVFGIPSGNPGLSAVTGLIRAAHAEHPERFGLLHLDGAATSAAWPALAGGEPEVCLDSDGRAAVPRVLPSASPADHEHRFDPGKTVLVTGGTGTLGALLARHLVTHHGVRHLVLASRRGHEAAGAAELYDDLTAVGAKVRVVACDITDREALRGLLAGIPDDTPLGTVIHLAGVLDDGLLESLTHEQLDRVLRAKAETATHLDVLTRDLDLDGFIMYSSLAGLIGAAGQANYAAANAYLDGLAESRHRRGLPAMSIVWGLWGQASGMTDHLDERDHARMTRMGVASMDSPEALRLFDAALNAGKTTIIAARLDREQLRQAADAHALPPILRDLVRPRRRQTRAVSAQPDPSGPMKRLAEASSSKHRTQLLLDLIRSYAAVVLRLAVNDVLPDRPFRDQGFESLTAVELRNRLNAATGLRLPSTIAFDHPTPAALAEHLHAELYREAAGTDGAILSELDRIADSFDTLDIDDDTRQLVTSRLESLLRKWSADTTPATGVITREALASASDQEMFALIDEELRNS